MSKAQADERVVPHLLYTVDEAAEALGCSRATIYGYVLSGDLPSVKLGRLRRIPATSLVDFVDQRVAL